MTQIAYQLYCSRNFPPLPATLRMLAGTGLRLVEGHGGLYPDLAAADRLAEALDTAGLAMASGHMEVPRCIDDVAGTVAIAARLGMRLVVAPYLEAGERPATAAGWHRLGTRLNQAAETYAAAGLGLAWHNHAFEFAPLPDGRLPIDILFGAAPALGLQFDAAWAVVAGVDPREVIDRHGGRIVAAHVKDVPPHRTDAVEDGWCAIGEGIVGWPDLVPKLVAAGCGLMVLEHDDPADDAAFVRASLPRLTGYLEGT